MSSKIFKSLFLCLCFMMFCGSARAQATPTVDIDLTNSSLQTLFETIEKQTPYVFSYRDDVLDTSKTVSIKCTGMSVNKVLDQALAGTDITYQIVSEKSIVIKPREKSSESNAPKITVTGTVFDNTDEPIIGGTVLVKGTSNGVATDFDGNFTLNNVPEDAEIVFSYIGFNTMSIKASDTAALAHVVMTENSQILDEVVVVGYGVQKKRDVSTAISQIKASDIADLPSSDFRQSMAGKMPGVTVMQTSGDPEGNNMMVRVRGVSSATAGNDPLYIVDGVPMENGLGNINPNDIESLEVLKDASAAAIYGSRGSNGVIIITTKKGTTERASVSYDGWVAWDKVSKKIDLMNAYQYAQYSAEAHTNAYLDLHPGGTEPNGSRPESYSNYPVELEPYLQGVAGLTDTDWQDEIFRTGISTNHNLSISGKAGDTNYFVSANYLKKEGVIINSDYKKYSFRANVDGKYQRLSYGVNMSPSYSESDRVNASGSYGSSGVVQSALTSSPIWPVYNADGSFNWQGNGYWRIGNDYQHNEILNPVALATLNKDKVTRFNFTGRVYVGFDFGRGFKFQTSLGGNYYGANNETYRPSTLPLLGKDNYDKPSNPVAEASTGSYYNWLVENQLTWNRDFGNHSINAVVVQSAQKETYKGVWVKATDYPNDYIQTITGGTVADGTSKTTQWSLASYLARVQYSYDGIYMLSAAIRADGSSRFGKNNRWGYFPSASAAWRFTGEDFFRNLQSMRWLEDGKIRFSYGETGNFNIGNYEHLSTMGIEDYILGPGNGSLVSGYKPTSVDNPDLTWEKTRMINVGLDLRAFNGFLTFTGEYYDADTHDMLQKVLVPRATGYGTTLMNIGRVNNHGVELSLGSRHTFANEFTYSFNATWAKNWNEVKELGQNNAPIISSGSVAHAYYITEVGKPIGSYYLMVQDGVFKNEEELKSYPHFDNTRPGDFKFVDVNGDGVIDVNTDRTVVGNYMPDFTYGFNGQLMWKGIDLSFAFQGVYGNEILNLNRRYLDNMEGNTNGTVSALDRWVSPTNPGNGYTNRANRKQTGNNSRTSTWHVEDGSYLRLQNLTIGYTLPAQWLKRFHIEKCRIYFSGNNLVTWTDYSGYNPEVSLRSSNALTPGEDYGTYPLARTFMIGLNITTF